MARIYLVRHAEAASGWGEHEDPGLSKAGRAQAEAMADKVAPLGPLPLYTSPLRRARETAAVLEGRWHTLALVEPGVGEIPSPSEDLAERRQWLGQALGSTWTDLGPRYTSWRKMVTGLLVGIPHDTVVVSHFVLINAALGFATGSDKVVIAGVENASVTVFDNSDHELALIEQTDRVGGPGQVL
jgi:broad specificity phosphatase PhoE